LNGLNILPCTLYRFDQLPVLILGTAYMGYFNLNPATTGLNTASIFIGGIIANLGELSPPTGNTLFQAFVFQPRR